MLPRSVEMLTMLFVVIPSDLCILRVDDELNRISTLNESMAVVHPPERSVG